jgi:hypothetical protein
MRLALCCLVILNAACLTVPNKDISCSWVAKTYAAAMLDGDKTTLFHYISSTSSIPDAERDPRLAALHVIRICDQWESPDKTEKNVLILFGGQLHAGVQGFDMVMIKEGTVWRVKRARPSKGSGGKPLFYDRDCGVSNRQGQNDYLDFSTGTVLPIGR